MAQGSSEKTKKAFLFMVSEDQQGFAEFKNSDVYVKDFGEHVNPNDIVEEIDGDMTAHFPPSGWSQTSRTHAPGGLDMQFPIDTKGLVIVRLPDTRANIGTVFANKGVSEMNVRGRGNCKVVSNAQCYDRTHNIFENGLDRTIVVFEINISNSIKSLGGKPGSHKVGRLPFMFDFEDLPGNLSPVFKEPHKHAGEAKAAPIINHGGIHPPTSASNMHVDP